MAWIPCCAGPDTCCAGSQDAKSGSTILKDKRPGCTGAGGDQAGGGRGAAPEPPTAAAGLPGNSLQQHQAARQGARPFSALQIGYMLTCTVRRSAPRQHELMAASTAC